MTIPLWHVAGAVPVAVALIWGGAARRVEPATGSVLPTVYANDNRRPAGVVLNDTLVLRLVLQRADWYPEGDDGPKIAVEAFGELGRVPSVPAPLIRVPAGTVVRVSVANQLSDSTAHIIGLGTHPVAASDTLHLEPGDTTTVTFAAGVPGTYLYRAVIGNNPDSRDSERETAGGAFVIDPVGGSPPDRVLVISIASHKDSSGFRNALAINGRSWPHTERLEATVGDSIRWRVINGSTRVHPMHLHGFYFKIGATGNGISSRSVPADRQRLDVTESMPAWHSRDIAWAPDRPGNWLFHCHLTFHVIPETRLDNRLAQHQDHSADATKHMAGLVLGIAVAPRPGVSYARTGRPRTLELFFTQGPQRGRAPVSYSYILKREGRVPRADSVQMVGSPIIVTRGQPTDIIVTNRAQEGTSIHWHGIELESWSDGVAGWSGMGTAMAPAVAPGKRFTARLTLPRAGTFMYHTHLNDLAQVTGGAVGAIVVLEPGEVYDPTRDHVYLGHWNGLRGNNEGPSLLINGDSIGAKPHAMVAGTTHRFRFINIGPAASIAFQILRDTTVAVWRARAKDGADLPTLLRVDRPAMQLVAVGETYDFEFTPATAGEYTLSAAFGAGPPTWRQRLIVR